MANPAVSGLYAGDTSGNGNTTVNRPSGASVGDLLLAFIVSDTATSAPTMPSGWTHVADRQDNGSGGQWSAVYSHIYASGDPASWTFNNGAGSTFGNAACVSCSNPNATTPVDADSASGTGTTGTSVTDASVTATVSGDLLVLLWVADNNTAVQTWPTGVTEITGSAPTTAGFDFGSKANLASGATGTLTASNNGTSDVLTMYAVLVKAQTSGSTPSGIGKETGGLSGGYGGGVGIGHDLGGLAGSAGSSALGRDTRGLAGNGLGGASGVGRDLGGLAEGGTGIGRSLGGIGDGANPSALGREDGGLAGGSVSSIGLELGGLAGGVGAAGIGRTGGGLGNGLAPSGIGRETRGLSYPATAAGVGLDTGGLVSLGKQAGGVGRDNGGLGGGAGKATRGRQEPHHVIGQTPPGSQGV